jgi:AraC-like DNA-binding protein
MRYFDDKELIIPGGRAEMVFSFNGVFDWYDADSTTLLNSKKYFVMGQRDKFFYIKSDKIVDIFGVRFRQGGLSAFVGIPVSEITNFFLSPDELFGSRAFAWIEQMNEASSIADKISSIEKTLSQILIEQKDYRLCATAIWQLKHVSANTKIDSFCASHNIHYKKLERTFLKITGYLPKPFVRINRLYKALYLARQNRNNLTDISYQCDYFDQSHFIRECREFTGQTPSKILTGEFKVVNLLLKKMPV